jgi:hypothetical protein
MRGLDRISDAKVICPSGWPGHIVQGRAYADQMHTFVPEEAPRQRLRWKDRMYQA